MGTRRSVSLCDLRGSLVSGRAPERQSPFPTAKRMALGRGVLCAVGKWNSCGRSDTDISTLGATRARHRIWCGDGHCALICKFLHVVRERGLPLTSLRAYGMVLMPQTRRWSEAGVGRDPTIDNSSVRIGAVGQER